MGLAVQIALGIILAAAMLVVGYVVLRSVLEVLERVAGFFDALTEPWWRAARAREEKRLAEPIEHKRARDVKAVIWILGTAVVTLALAAPLFYFMK